MLGSAQQGHIPAPDIFPQALLYAVTFLVWLRAKVPSPDASVLRELI